MSLVAQFQTTMTKSNALCCSKKLQGWCKLQILIYHKQYKEMLTVNSAIPVTVKATVNFKIKIIILKEA